MASQKAIATGTLSGSLRLDSAQMAGVSLAFQREPERGIIEVIMASLLELLPLSAVGMGNPHARLFRG